MKNPIWWLVTMVVFVLGYFAILGYSIKHSDGFKRDALIYQECERSHGIMIPRTYICLKKDATITLETMK